MPATGEPSYDVSIYSGAQNNTIGGTANGAGNVIAGATLYGVWIYTTSGPAASNNTVAGNYIGTDAAGDSGLGNGIGVEVDISNNTIGGGTAAAANLISGNSGYGIQLQAPSTNTGNLLENNYVGTGPGGSGSLPNGGALDILSGVSVKAAGSFNGTVNVAGTLDLSGSNDSIVGALTGSGTVTNQSAAFPATLTVNGTGTFGGVIQNGPGFTTGMTVAGGTVTLSGANTYSGTTTISGGILQVSGTGSLGTGTVVDDSELAYALNSGYTETVPNAISGTGFFSQQGTGSTVIFTGANSYVGTTIAAGTLQVGAGGTTGSIGTGSVTDNATLFFDLSSSVDIAHAISGTGTVTVTSTGGSITQSRRHHRGLARRQRQHRHRPYQRRQRRQQFHGDQQHQRRHQPDQHGDDLDGERHHPERHGRRVQCDDQPGRRPDRQRRRLDHRRRQRQPLPDLNRGDDRQCWPDRGRGRQPDLNGQPGRHVVG